MTNIGPKTKGFRLATEIPEYDLRQQIKAQLTRIDDDIFAWPIITAENEVLNANTKLMAETCQKYDALLAPHVKTHMSKDLYFRQAEAGAWAATVAMPHQLRAVYDWGVKRILLANEIADIRDARWLAHTLQADPELEVWLEVDSLAGLKLLETAFASETEISTINRLHLLVEVGVPGGRTGVRTTDQAITLAKAIKQAGLQVSGVIGFEGPVAHDASAPSLARVQAWLDGVINIADQVAQITNVQPGETPFVVSVGGSAYIDLMLPALASVKAKGWQGVIRSGAYLTHDAIHYEELNPFSRIPGGHRLNPALTVWAQVLSVPEPGLAIVGAGKRDLAFDLDLPVPLWVRTPDGFGRLGPRQTLPRNAHVSELNDQHTFVKFDPFDPDLTNQSETALQVGDVIGFGISHPCTAFDKWRYLTIVQGDQVLDIYPLDF